MLCSRPECQASVFLFQDYATQHLILSFQKHTFPDSNLLLLITGRGFVLDEPPLIWV